ncbi:MAG: response regulator [bacterium]|nr:response regulator [bacterium]
MSGGRPIVLLVDDEPGVLSALRRTLRREGLAIETATNGTEALDRVRTGAPVDLVISDHKMPGRTGVELLTTIRAESPGTARILLSGWTSEIDPAELRAADCAAVLSKPWDDEELKTGIQAALGRD